MQVRFLPSQLDSDLKRGCGLETWHEIDGFLESPHWIVADRLPPTHSSLNEDEKMDDYKKYRGKCKEMSEELCSKDLTLKLVRGYYICPFWGKQEHWWTEDKDGNIIDPTKNQFPSKGFGEYSKFDGNVECSECGKIVSEEHCSFAGRYPICSNRCYGKFVGVTI